LVDYPLLYSIREYLGEVQTEPGHGRYSIFQEPGESMGVAGNFQGEESYSSLHLDSAVTQRNGNSK
jgi:hypothetical protein